MSFSSNNPFLRPNLTLNSNSQPTSQFSSSSGQITNNFFKPSTPNQTINSSIASNSFFPNQNSDSKTQYLIRTNPFMNNQISSINSTTFNQATSNQSTLNSFFQKTNNISSSNNNFIPTTTSNAIPLSFPTNQNVSDNKFSKYSSNSFSNNNTNPPISSNYSNNFFSNNKWNNNINSQSDLTEELDLSNANLYKQHIRIIDLISQQSVNESLISNNICLLPNYIEFSIEELRAFNNWKKRKKLLDPKNIVLFQKLTNESRILLYKAEKYLKENFSDKELSKLEKWMMDYKNGKLDNFLEFLVKPSFNLTGSKNYSVMSNQFYNNNNNNNNNNYNNNNFNFNPGVSNSGGTTWGSVPSLGFQDSSINNPWVNQKSSNAFNSDSKINFFNNSSNDNNNFMSFSKANTNWNSSSTSNNSQFQLNHSTKDNLGTNSTSSTNLFPFNNLCGNNKDTSYGFKNNSFSSITPFTSCTAFSQLTGNSTNNSQKFNLSSTFPSTTQQSFFTPSATIFNNDNNGTASNGLQQYNTNFQWTDNINPAYSSNINSNLNQTSYFNQNNNFQDLSQKYLQPNIVNNFLISNSIPFSDIIYKLQTDWENNDLSQLLSKPSLKDQIKQINEKNSLNYEEVESENKYVKICQQNFVPLRNSKREDKIKPEKEVKKDDRDPELFLQNLIKDQEVIQSQKVMNLISSSINERMKYSSRSESMNNQMISNSNENSITSKNFSSNNRLNPEIDKDIMNQVINKSMIPVKISSSTPKNFSFVIETKKSYSISEFKTMIAKYIEKKKFFSNLRIDCSDFVVHLENNIVLDQSTFNFEDLIRKYMHQIFNLGVNYVINLNLIFSIKFLDKYVLKNNAFSKIFKEDEIDNLDMDSTNSQKINKFNNKDDFYPNLTKNYKTKPDFQILNKMEKYQLENVNNFEISNEFGKIKYLEPIDLSYINLDNIQIEKGQIFLDKIDGDMKNLNKQGELELYGINTPEDIDTEEGYYMFVKLLKERCNEIGVI